jgi:hypothetical protein
MMVLWRAIIRNHSDMETFYIDSFFLRHELDFLHVLFYFFMIMNHALCSLIVTIPMTVFAGFLYFI